MSESVIRSDIEFSTRAFNVEVAKQLGVDAAIFLRHLEHLISISNTPEYEGRWWTYETLKDLRKKWFPFWSRNKLWRIKNRLVKAGYVLQRNFNSYRFPDENGNIRRDQTNWYALNLEKISEIPGVYISDDRVKRGAFTQNG